MKPARASLSCLFLLLAGLLLRAPLAAAQQPPPHLTLDLRSRLTAGASNSALAPWQREFMLGVARGGPGRATASPASSGRTQRTTRATADDGEWNSFPLLSSLTGRLSPTAFYDANRERMVVFGGFDGTFRNDVWTLSLTGEPTWSELLTAETPPSGRALHAAIYDPVSDHMVVFGGLDAGGIRNDAWVLRFSDQTWKEITTAGTPPSVRCQHTAIYDPVGEQMVVYGGRDSSAYFSDTWALTLAGNPAWTALSPAGTTPPRRYLHAAIYDSRRERMIVFGGQNVLGYLNDVWELSLSGSPSWMQLDPGGGPPSARYSHAAIYDATGDRMVLFGGGDDVGYLNDVWTLSFARDLLWIELTPTGGPPTGRFGNTAVYDPGSERMVVFGGADLDHILIEVWSLPLSKDPDWSELTPVGGGSPAARAGHTGIYDSLRERMVVFAGYDGTNTFNDVWALTLTGDPTWSPLAPTSTPPTERILHTAIYDPVRDRMVVFAGSGPNGNLSDLWALSLSGSPAWIALTPAGTPPAARYGHTAFYDPVRDRMVVFGGVDSANAALGDAWALSLAGGTAWSALTPAGSPPPARAGHTAIYDPARDRMVMFGGTDNLASFNDVWALSLVGTTAWSALIPSGAPPLGRSLHSSLYDPARDRMVVFGGNFRDTLDHLLNDVWALSLAGSPAWSELAPAGERPLERHGHAAIYDPAADRMVVFAGAGIPGAHGDVWTLVWGEPVSVTPGTPGRLQLSAPRPNPSRGQTIVEFELAEPAEVVLDVFDARGRRVKRIADGFYPAGRHATAWQGDDDRGRAVGSGLYFIRMEEGGRQATRRTVRIR